MCALLYRPEITYSVTSAAPIYTVSVENVTISVTDNCDTDIVRYVNLYTNDTNNVVCTGRIARSIAGGCFPANVLFQNIAVRLFRGPYLAHDVDLLYTCFG